METALEALSLGFTEAEAAQLAGVSRRVVNNWRNGKTPHARKLKPVRRSWRATPENLEVMRSLRIESGLTHRAIAEMMGCSVGSVERYLRGMPEARCKREETTMDSAEHPAPDEDIAALKARIHQLELQNDVMRELLDILKADPHDQTWGATNKEKAEAVGRLKGRYTVAELCRMLDISRSTCYYHLAHPRMPDADADIRDAVVSIFEGASKTRGYRYIKHVLETEVGIKGVSEKRVRRVMGQEGLKVIYLKKRRHYNSYAGEASPAPPNLVGRDFKAGLPNHLWLTDITEFKLPDAPKVYLSPILDCFDGKPIAWRIGLRPDSSLSDGCLLDAVAKRQGGEPTVVHNDRGIHYRTYGWMRICKENGLVRSMSAKGCSPDNSACEGFFGRLKNEFFYYRDWRGVSAEDFIEQLDAYLRYYCEERPKESLGWLSPNEFRRSLGMPV
ncbi:MAG: IS3 family transposase [Coriobacteriales bacterium]|nr:IS3 family transposase [Coriobacteriales bacterium]